MTRVYGRSLLFLLPFLARGFFSKVCFDGGSLNFGGRSLFGFLFFSGVVGA